MNDQRTSYGAENKHFFGTKDSCLESNRLSCEKNCIHKHSSSGYYGRLAGRQNMGGFQNLQNSQQVFNYLNLYFI